MPRFSADTLIKSLRKAKGLTQHELCEGICSQDELSRIERNKHRPTWYVFERIMQKLGEDPNRYYSDVIRPEDKRIMDLRDQLKHKLRNGTTEEIAASIQEIENDKAFEDKFHLQYLLSAKATLAFDLGEYDNMYNYALEAISLTKTDFDLSRIDEYVFFADEILIIEQIAVALFCKAKVMDSTEILIKLTQSLDKNYFDTEEKAKPHTSILYNLSKNFMNLKKYEECIKVCDEGIAVSKKYRDAFFIPMFMINKACCFFSAEDNDEGVKLTKKVYALLDANDRHNEISEIEAYIYNAYGVSVPFD